MTWRLKKDASRNKHGFSWFQTSLQGETYSEVNKIPEKMVGWSGVSISRGEILSPLFSPNFAGCLPATSFSHALEATSTQHSLFDLASPPTFCRSSLCPREPLGTIEWPLLLCVANKHSTDSQRPYQTPQTLSSLDFQTMRIGLLI